jgi:hypothetical protein
LARDYELFKDSPNITYIGVCATPGADLKSMKNEQVTMKIKDLPFPKMLDSSGATLAAYHMTANVPYQLVILDSAGKIAFNKDPRYSLKDPRTGKRVYTRVKAAQETLAKSPGLLTDVEVPKGMSKAVHLYSLQQFDKLALELARAKKTDKSAETKAFAQMLEDRIAAYRAKRIEELKALAQSDPIKAFREVEAFLLCFPRAKEASAARSLHSRLRGNSKVRAEQTAQMAFQRVVVPAMNRVRDKRSFEKKVAPMVAGYMKKFGSTEFAKTAQASVDAYQKGLR